MKKVIFFVFICIFSSHTAVSQKPVEFYFSHGGFNIGQRSIHLIKNENSITATFNPWQRIEEYSVTVEIEEVFFNSFFEELDPLNIPKWKNKYVNSSILDGYEWNLKIRFDNNQKEKETYGVNDYPKDWDKFIKIIFKYFPQMSFNYYEFKPS